MFNTNQITSSTSTLSSVNSENASENEPSTIVDQPANNIPAISYNPTNTVDNQNAEESGISFETEKDDQDLSDDITDEDQFDPSEETEFVRILKSSAIDKELDRIQTRLRKNGKPAEYDLKTCWAINAMPCFNDLTKGPSDLYVPRVFLWFPHYLIGESLRCPTCKEENRNNRLIVNGFSQQPKARRVIDISDSFYMMTSRYACSNKESHLIRSEVTNGKAVKKYSVYNFNGYSDGIMKQLPEKFQIAFPAVLTHKSGLSKTLLNLLRSLVQNSVGVGRFSKILRELYMLHYNTLKSMYLSTTVEFKQKEAPQQPSLSDIGSKINSKKPEPFSSFGDRHKYAGLIPSSRYISYVYRDIMKQIKPVIDTQITKLGGRIPSGDPARPTLLTQPDRSRSTVLAQPDRSRSTVLAQPDRLRSTVLAQPSPSDIIACPNNMRNSRSINYTSSQSLQRPKLPRFLLPRNLDGVTASVNKRKRQRKQNKCNCCGRTDCKGKGGLKYCQRRQHLNRKITLEKLMGEDSASAAKEAAELKSSIIINQQKLLEKNLIFPSDIIN